MWLTGGDINALEDPTPILEVDGTATRAGDSWPFSGNGHHRQQPRHFTAEPGDARRQSDLPRTHRGADLRPATPRGDSCSPLIPSLSDGGTLDVRIDPRGMFDSVDFSTLAPSGSATTLTSFPTTSAGAGGALFKGLVSSGNMHGVYQFTWTNQSP